MCIKKILLLIAILPWLAVASELKDKFLQTTQLREASYELLKGPESCLEGRLRILDFENHLTVMLGARPLVMGIGQKNETSQQGQCTTKASASFDNRTITSERTEKCKNLEFTFVTDVQLQKESMIYSRKVFAGKKLKTSEKCTLKIKSAAEST